MRVVNVAHGAFFMLGAVVAWFVAGHVPGPPVWGWLAALVVAPLVVGAVAALVDITVLKRLNYEPEAVIVAVRKSPICVFVQIETQAGQPRARRPAQ